MALALPELKVLPLGIVAYALAQAGVPRDALVMVLQAAVIGVSLIVPGGALVPSLAAALAALGYARALPSGAPDTLYVAAGLATTGLLMTLATGRLRRIEAQATREARRLGDEAARAVAESEATRQATEVAAAVLDVATGISAATEPSAIAEQIASGTASQVRAVGVVLLLWDDASETYRVGAIHGPHARAAARCARWRCGRTRCRRWARPRPARSCSSVPAACASRCCAACCNTGRSPACWAYGCSAATSCAAC